ncbi:glycerate kinase [Flammeovirgaceae bacterium SG7u.111]|nr:glycerate kinase [Flammeovirgaceae bacterium SG7u.132]WPO33158.1 glycerate kinase [Flammeovirgaceae bacterium SG7u.111]
MNFLISPNSFKGSLGAFEVAEAIERGLKKASKSFETRCVPIADGGDHFADVLTKALGGRFVESEVTDPLGAKVKAKFGITPKGVAIIEMAKASGLALLNPNELDALNASSIGTGELMKKAVDEGCKEIILGIGGSATTDAGVGILKALGIRFFDKDGKEVWQGGEAVGKIQSVDTSGLDTRFEAVDIKIACDVENELLGERSAAKVFAPQKGASQLDVQKLDESLKSFADFTQKELGKEIGSLTHGGAAGGIAAGLYAWLGAELCNGIDLVMDQLGFDEHLPWADVVITAEGKLDFQTLDGKGPYGIAIEAKKHGILTVAFAGAIPPSELEKFEAFDTLLAIADSPMSLEKSMKECGRLLENAAFQVGKLLLVSRG